MRLDERLLVGADVFLDGNGLISRRRAVMVQRGAKLVEIKMKSLRDQRQIRIHVAVLFAHQEAGDRRIVVDDQAVFAVKELAPRRQHRHFANAVLLRQHFEVLRAEDLQPPQVPRRAPASARERHIAPPPA